jgi:tetratricopeptide (TPR) repeat protein
MAYFCLRLGRYEDGLAHARAGVAAAQAAGDMGFAARLTVLAAALLQGTGSRDDWLVAFERAYEAAERARHPEAMSSALNGIAEAHRVRGDLPLACRFYERSMALDRERGDSRGLMITLSNLTCTLIDMGDLARARAAFDESVALMRDLGNAGPMCCTLDIAAALASASNDPTRALRFHGAARTRLAATEMRLEPVDESFAQRWAAKARAGLPPDTAAGLESEGRALKYEAALAEIEQWTARRP